MGELKKDLDTKLQLNAVGVLLHQLHLVSGARFGETEDAYLFSQSVLLNLVGNFMLEVTDLENPKHLVHNIECFKDDIDKLFANVEKQKQKREGTLNEQ